jgi:hypothetical protein
MPDPTQPLQAQQESTVDPLILQAALQRIRGEQNLVIAVIAGAAAALAGACTWAVITVVTHYQVGWMAVGVGFLVGYAVKTFGKGIDRSFGIVGAVWSLIGCAAGNLFTIVGTIAKEQNIPIMSILEKLDLDIIASLMQATFNPMDVLFYGIAIYEGYKFSFRQLTQADLLKIG